MAKTLGIMLDCSRNAVMRPEKVKEFAALIQSMGYNMLQLYTEETYEVENEPFFGYMRGRYSMEEIRDIDAYCRSIGVELIPCIQTLAHLGHLNRWNDYSEHFDCMDILLVGDPRVYELIDNMFATLAKTYTSRRLHIGMDEAMFLGLGRYKAKNGYRGSGEILREHLAKVAEIAAKYGFKPMMWSDMFIRVDHDGEYYVKECKLSQAVIDSVPASVEPVYWDYYSTEKEHYDIQFDMHAKFNSPTVFAGGIWTWTGYAPNLRYSLDATEAAMKSAAERDIDTVFFTEWGDDGADCSRFTTMAAMFAAAQMANGNFDRADIAAKFEAQVGYSFEEFMNLELPNLPQTDLTDSHYHDPCKYLLFNDPFLGLFDFSVGEGFAAFYADAAKKLAASVNGRAYDYLFDFEQKLCEALAVKCDLGIRIRKAYDSGDKAAIQAVAGEIDAVSAAVRAVYESFRTLWLKENKGHGLEVQEMRFGQLLLRLESCQRRLLQVAHGEIDRIDELEEKPLVMHEGFEGKSLVFNSYLASMSACY